MRTPSSTSALLLPQTTSSFSSLLRFFSRIVPILHAPCFLHLSYFDALCAAVDQAKDSVWMETCVARPLTLKRNSTTKLCRYIMKGDALGNRLLAKLDAAAGNQRRRAVQSNLLFARSRRAPQRAVSTCGL